MTEATFWNGVPCEARRVRVRVGDSGRFRAPWFAPHVGELRDAVEILHPSRAHRARLLTGVHPGAFYIDDEDGSGWAKVTDGRGSPHAGHRGLDAAFVLERDGGILRDPS
jgi:hypothetical protein